MKPFQTLLNGLLKENPIFVIMLGMCPTLGVSTNAMNGIGMGMATTFVLTMSNLIVSLVAGYIPDKVRIPVYVVIIATFVTIVQLTMQAWLPGLYASLGLFIPLIVVNCIVLGRAEAFACKNNALLSIMDGLGMGCGFTLALTLLGSIRELLGTGKVFDITIYPESSGSLLFVLAPGAFIVLGYLIAAINKINKS